MQQPNSSINFGDRPKFRGSPFTPAATKAMPCTSIQSSCIGKNVGSGMIGTYDGGSSTPGTNVDHNAYTDADLQQILRLPTPFTIDMLAVAESNSIQSIRRNDSIAASDRTSFEKFIKEAAGRLRAMISPAFENQFRSSTYPKQARLSSAALETGNPTQVQPHTPYTHTMPSEYYRGDLNPIARRTVNKYLNIDSRFRKNYYGSTASNFRYTPTTKFDNILDIKVSAVEIPFTFFNISKQLGNNFFAVEVPCTNASGVDVVDKLTIEMPSGNYDYDGLVELLNTRMRAGGGVFESISFSIDKTHGRNGSGRMTVSLAATNTFSATTFTLDFVSNVNGLPDEGTPLPLKLGWMMGFRNGRYENCVNGMYVSEGVVDIVGTKYVYFVLEDYVKSANETFFAEFNESTMSGSVLARISVPSAQILDLTPNNTVAPLREYHGLVSITNLHIQLLDDFGRNLDLSNMDISFCLSMTAAYNL